MRRQSLKDCRQHRSPWSVELRGPIIVALPVAALMLGGCMAPIGADRVTARQAYAQVEANALRTGKPSSSTLVALHRYGLRELAERHPDEAVRQLHQKALSTGERELLFALSELSYVAGGRILREVKPWDPRDARDYYLGSAVYAWIYLFGQAREAPPSAFDRRFREACDFYNYGLGLAFVATDRTNAVVRLENSVRRLPVGEIEVQLMGTELEKFNEILLADQFRVRGLSVRNREPGIGTPLICVLPENPELRLRPAVPATALLRGPDSLPELAAGPRRCSLELYAALEEPSVVIGQTRVPLEVDLTVHRAYTLNQSRVWKLGKLDFLAPSEHVKNQLMLNQPFAPERIPVVFVHGTFSSPVTWAEMANALTADPVLRRRYQIWSFMYGSGNPLMQSVADLRDALAAEVRRLDPQGTNGVLRQMVVLGHSQGGLLTKGTAVDTGDRLWTLLSTNRIEDVDLSPEDRDELRRRIFLTPLPFVKRVIFIATPHRGSYLSGGLARRLGRRLVSLPDDLVRKGRQVLTLGAGSEVDKFMRGKMPTSLDGMSPKSPALLTLAEIPVAPGIKSHSIIPVLDADDYLNSKDGVVSYQSAHVEPVDSEFVLRSKHSCLNQPAAIEEVRRILHEHLAQSALAPSETAAATGTQP